MSGVSSTGATWKLRFRSRPEAVAESLRESILSGALKPGERLIEQKLAARFGIGQPTLREALKELEIQGFVRKSPQKGTCVTQLSHDDFRKILEVRMALEVLAIERATVNLTPAAALELGGFVETMTSAAHAFDLATFHKNDLMFHRLIWDLTGNEYLGIALERVAFGLFAFVLLQRPQESRNEFLAAADQHKQILAGLRSGDPAVAREAFLQSTLNFWSQHHRVHIDPSAYRTQP